MTSVVGDPFTRRNMKLALLATALFWLIVWGVIGWRVGVAAPALAAFALVIAAYAALGAWSFRAPERRLVAAGAALALTIAVAFPTFLDMRLLAGGLAAAAATSVDPRPEDNTFP